MKPFLLAALATTLVGAWQKAPDLRGQVWALANLGRLDDAERLAREGGPQLSETIGDVLVLRGKLVAADSFYRATIARDLPGRRSAEAALAELAERRGDRDEAFRRATAITRAYTQSAIRWSAEDRVAAGRAYVILGERSAAAVKQALAAFDDAVAADSTNLDGRLLAGDLLLERYNAPDAKASFDEVLARDPEQARALLGLARVAEFTGKPDAMALLRRSVAANPALVGSQVMLARFQMEAEQYDSAKASVRRALAVDSSSMDAWSLLGAMSWLRGDSTELRRAKAAADRLNPRSADFNAALAEAAMHQRRYGEAMRLARVALALDSTSARVLTLLGNNALHAGNIEEGRGFIERAFAIDPFNLWNKNTLDLLDNLRKFTTIDRGHFRIVAPAKEADLLAMYVVPLLTEAFDSLSARYQYQPPSQIRLELYRQHADFSVRTVGLTGLGALGVSFGPVLMMDAPAARQRGDFNWGSTAWHELTHTFTLGLSEYRTPRWLSEGLSVLEERRARPEWGAKATVEFLSAYAGGQVRPVSQLSDGFVHPRYESEVIFSYYDASLVCEMIEAQHGSSALVSMLTAYRDGLDTPAVFARVLGVKPEEFDRQFDTWVRARFAGPLQAIRPGDGKSPPSGAFVSAVRTGIEQMQAGNLDSARSALSQAQAMFPEYSASGAPAWFLAELARKRGDLHEALNQVQRITTQNGEDWDANMFEADVRMQLGDSAGTLTPLQRLVWISPYEVPVHVRLAELASHLGDHVLAIRERRAIVALDPTDALDAHYQLARELADAGDIAASRKELLSVLEMAPAFEKAQALLLDLSKRNPR